MRSTVKASKRLLAAIAIFLGSMFLFIGVCVAWFAKNKDVDAAPVQPDVATDDIEEFIVVAYYLNKDGVAFKKAAPNNESGNVYDVFNELIEVDYNSDGILDSSGTPKDSMRPYTTLSNSYATAVLFEINYKIRVNSKTYRIYASCPNNSILQVVASNSESAPYNSPLSNSVAIAAAQPDDPDADEANKKFSATEGTREAFVLNGSNYDKTYKINYITGITTMASAEDPEYFYGTSYLMMDYDPELFAYLSARMLEVGGSLNSRLVFLGDITIGIEAEKDETVAPDSIELINGHGSDFGYFVQEAATVQEASLIDVISPTWLFNVNYSDGTVRTVSAGSPGLSITIDTTEAGQDKTATVKYSAGGSPVTTAVQYTITEGAHIHNYETRAIVAPTQTTTGTVMLQCLRSDCNQPNVSLTLPVLTNSGYTITPTSGGMATYSINLSGTTVSFEAPMVVKVTGITLNRTTAQIEAGSTVALTATVAPADATNKTVNWRSSANSVATVSSNGTVTGVSAGTATIYATTEDGGYVASCTVTVTAADVAVTGVTVSPTTAQIDVGSTTKLTATVAPSNATNKSVSWSSSNTAVATVSSNGTVTGVSAGTATITATTADGSFTASCTVTVVSKHTVTFNTDGGSAVASQQVNHNGTATRPADPTKSGYVFDDWYTTASGNTKFNFNTQITADTTVYAHWREQTTGYTPNGEYTFARVNSEFVSTGEQNIFTYYMATDQDQAANIKVQNNSDSIVVTVNVASGTYVTLDINAYSASSGSTSRLKATTSGLSVSSGSSPLTFANGSANASTQTIVYVANADGTATITIARDNNTTRINLITVTVSAAPAHTHTYATAWTYDGTNHWHAATCEHTTLTADTAAHSLTTTNNATQHWSTCSVCGYESAKTNHTLTTTKNATQHWSTCAACGYESAKTNHTWDSGTVTTAPTATDTGVMTYTCTGGCGATYTDTIPATGGGNTGISGKITAPTTTSSTNVKGALATASDTNIAVTVSANTNIINSLTDGYTTCWEVKANGGTVTIKNNSGKDLRVTVYVQAKDSSSAKVCAASFGDDTGKQTSTTEAIALTTTIANNASATLTTAGRRPVLYKIEYEEVST